MTEKTWEALFLCTGNSARSILAEAILDRLGAGRIRAHSAGSHPTGRVHPMTIELLQEHGYDLSRFRSKSWDEFAGPDAPALDFVFTVCDGAANEPCPVWPGGPVTAHWGVPDPAALEGTSAEQRRRFSRVYMELHRRIELFTQLPIQSLDRLALRARLEEIGRSAITEGGED
jgi:protein-tyrosine-phosphatase